ncbi:helix-turn-helix domain-containing protein [Streptomyces sp. KLOTTS4A1]|uniref:helix-turn-helix domain-containing protein n=1 Tax=Streptomyces sp. KLOTTS4A1 TaxID=3390996 RepID=UPI0039F556EC
MGKPRDPDPSSRRILIGEELRHARERAPLTQQALGELLFVSGSYVGQMESGARRILPDMARRIDEALDTGDFFFRHCTKANKSPYPERFAEAAEAEALAIEIRQYGAMLIPGLLQTSDYARSLFLDYQPTASDQAIEDLLTNRLERTRLLDDPTKPLLWAVIDEAALRRPVGGTSAMADQLDHVARLIRSRRVIVQVLPFTAGSHAAQHGPLKLMYFDDAPPLLFVEAPMASRLLDDPAAVARMELSYDLVRAAALTPRQSLALIDSLAEDYAHEPQEPTL